MTIYEIQTYWRVIRKRFWLISLLVGVTLGVTLLLSYLAAPIYKATSYFQVTAPLPASVSLFADFRPSTSRDELFYTKNNFLKVLQTEHVAWQVIGQLGLQMSAEDLMTRMVVESDENSDFVRLSVTADSAANATAIANALLDTAVQYFGELNAGTITSNREFIQQQMQKTKAELDEAQGKTLQFQLDNTIGSRDGLLTTQETLIRTAKANRDTALAEGKTSVAAAFDRIIAQREKEFQERIVLSTQLASLQAEAQRIDDTYTSLLNTETQAVLKENEILSARYIEVVPAHEPTRPLPRLRTQYLIVAAVVSLVVGVILAFLLEGVQDTMAVPVVKDKVGLAREQVVSSLAK